MFLVQVYDDHHIVLICHFMMALGQCKRGRKEEEDENSEGK